MMIGTFEQLLHNYYRNIKASIAVIFNCIPKEINYVYITFNETDSDFTLYLGDKPINYEILKDVYINYDERNPDFTIYLNNKLLNLGNFVRIIYKDDHILIDITNNQIDIIKTLFDNLEKKHKISYLQYIKNIFKSISNFSLIPGTFDRVSIYNYKSPIIARKNGVLKYQNEMLDINHIMRMYCDFIKIDTIEYVKYIMDPSTINTYEPTITHLPKIHSIFY